MPFPQVGSTATDFGSSESTLVINLPSGIVSGNRLQVTIAYRGSAVATWPAGWTQMVRHLNQADFVLETRKRVADGTEGATITVTITEARSWCSLAYRFTGHHGTTEPAVSGEATGASASPDPPSLNPADWDVEDTLWVPVAGTVAPPFTAYPANYTNGFTIDVDGAIGIASARRENAVASENPGTFTAGNNSWSAHTIAIRPAAAGAGIPKIMHHRKMMEVS